MTDSSAINGFVIVMTSYGNSARRTSSGARNGIGNASDSPRPTSTSRAARRSAWRTLSPPKWTAGGTMAPMRS